MGILIKRYQTGGTIYTSDYNSPQLKSYNDSLGSYNESRLLRDKLIPQAEKFNKYKADYYKTVNDRARNGESLTDEEKKEDKLIYGNIYKEWGRLNDYISVNNSNLRSKYTKKAGIEPDWDKETRHERNVPNPYFTFEQARREDGSTYQKRVARHTDATDKFYPDVYHKPKQKVKYADPEIVEKQQKLKDAGLYDGPLDGIFGSKSKEALKKLEERNRLKEEEPKEEIKEEDTKEEVPKEDNKKGPYIKKMIGGFGPTNLFYVDSAGVSKAIASNALTSGKYKDLKVEEVPYGNKKPKGLLIKK